MGIFPNNQKGNLPRTKKVRPIDSKVRKDPRDPSAPQDTQVRDALQDKSRPKRFVEDRYNCEACKGLGLVDDNSKICPVCHGTGKV